MSDSAVALRDRILSGKTSAAAVCRDASARIHAHDRAIHAFQSLMTDRAMARAEEIDRDPGRFRGRALAGDGWELGGGMFFKLPTTWVWSR